jgi:hypothetical protein
MPRLVIRNLDARILARLEEQARKDARSLQNEGQRRWAERVFSDSTFLILEMRGRHAR